MKIRVVDEQPKTGDYHVAVRRLRAKIDADFAPKLIRTVRRMGYLLEEIACH